MVLTALDSQGVPWLYPVEINSLSMRTKGAALATASNWLANYLIVEITPAGIASLGWRFYLIWMFFNALFIPVRLHPTFLFCTLLIRHLDRVAAVPRDRE